MKFSFYGFFLFVLVSLTSFYGGAMNEPMITTTRMGQEQDPGVRVYQAQAQLLKAFPVYEQVLKAVFTKAHQDGVRFLFLPRFGKIEPADLVAIAFEQFEKSLAEFPDSALKVILISYETNVASIIAQTLDAKKQQCKNDSVCKRIVSHQGNIVDILHNLQWNENFKRISASFSPYVDTIAHQIEKIILDAPREKPAITIDLLDLISNMPSKK